MTRKRKIQFAAVPIALVLIAIAFWPGDEEAPVRVTFAGVRSNDHNTMVFTITNSAKATFTYSIGSEELKFRDWYPWQTMYSFGDKIAGHSTTNYTTRLVFTNDARWIWTNQWRIHVAYYEPLPDTITIRTRKALGNFASKHNWHSMTRWTYPREQWKHAYSPVMFANKPVAAESK